MSKKISVLLSVLFMSYTCEGIHVIEAEANDRAVLHEEDSRRDFRNKAYDYYLCFKNHYPLEYTFGVYPGINNLNGIRFKSMDAYYLERNFVAVFRGKNGEDIPIGDIRLYPEIGAMPMENYIIMLFEGYPDSQQVGFYTHEDPTYRFIDGGSSYVEYSGEHLWIVRSTENTYTSTTQQHWVVLK